MNDQGQTLFLNTDLEIIIERLIRGKHKRPMVSRLNDAELRVFVRRSSASFSRLNDAELRVFVRRHWKERLPFYQQAKEVVTG